MEANGGASHLILFDTSPLQVHTHANFLHAYVHSGKQRTSGDVHACACNLFAHAVARDIAASGKEITSQSQRTSFGVFSGVIMGLMMSLLAIPIHFGAKALYAAFDPEYGEYTNTF